MSDPNGHGTSVSGVIAAQVNNGTGVAGIAGEFDVDILPIRVANYKGESYVSDIIKAIDYAISKQVDVINLSLGSNQYSSLENAAIQRAASAGIIVVAAAGNEAADGNPVSYPASYENVISVGAVNQLNKRSSFSTYNAYVDVAAPGEGVWTTTLSQGYGYVNGTSFASPITAGVLAMAKGLNPDLTVEGATELIHKTADDLGEAGFDNEYGYGLVNAKRVVDTVLASTVPEAVTGITLDKHNVKLSLASTMSAFTKTNDLDKQRLDSLSQQHTESAYLYTDKWYSFTTTMTANTPDAAKPVLSISTKALFLKKGQSQTINASLSPAVSSSETIIWTSSNPNVAVVDSSGKITGTGYGKTVITASWNGQTVECVVKITADTLNPTTALFETILPADAANKDVIWKSSNTQVAAVDAYGIITAKTAGTATITATTVDGGFTASSTVTVEGPTWTAFKPMNVATDKVFNITFNFPVDKPYLTKANIYIARDANGLDRVADFNVSVNAVNKNIIHVSPETAWPEGSYYLFINDKLKSTDGKLHKKNIRMPFTVTTSGK
jgi:uncharacterized protein YjdB